ncbi:hypothetical protein FQN57_002245 [Myotisia sp. PD_48]|nr:hypothetical protein FQN57_002245 [Myotisia sp. PD_48]
MSPINSLWFKWKSWKLPWRKMFLSGEDLAGNTFWEFRDQNNVGRFRRIVKYNPKTHYADVKVSPQWHQWLRYVRPEPPSIEEQQDELQRQERIKYLAQQADERWATKPSFLDKPQEHQPRPALQSHDPVHDGRSSMIPENRMAAEHSTVSPDIEPKEQGLGPKQKFKNPWTAKTGGPSENWKPESWNPSISNR